MLSTTKPSKSRNSGEIRDDKDASVVYASPGSPRNHCHLSGFREAMSLDGGPITYRIFFDSYTDSRKRDSNGGADKASDPTSAPSILYRGRDADTN